MSGAVLDPVLERQRHLARKRSEILRERLEQLPASDQTIFQSGSLALALNSSLCGLIANNYLRRALNITQAPIAAALPMAFLPFATTWVFYEACISQPLMEGDLNCATCASVRGGLIGALIGSVYPALTAIPLCGGLAARYSTAPLPSKENMFRYWMTVCKPAYKRLRFAVILQAALGMYLGSRHHDIYIKMLKLPEPGRDPEELKE